MRLRLFLAALCACAGLAVHASQVSKPATPTGTGFILGRVVDADTGRGISGALVTLAPPPAPTSPIGELTEARPPAPPTGLTLQTGASSRRTLTALDGRFLFRDLPKGSFAIYASSSRHVPGAYGQLRYQGPAQTIVLAEGERQGAVTVKLWRFGSISGIVRDENGEPAVGVGVECSRRVFTGGQKRFATTGTTNFTDDRGTYRVASLVPGNYICANVLNPVTVPISVAAGTDTSTDVSRRLANTGASTAPAGVRIGDFIYTTGIGTTRGPVAPPPDANGRLMAYAPQYYGGAATTSQASLITLKPAEDRTGVDIQLKLVPAIRITGRLVGPGGPMGFFGLRLVPASGNDMASEGQAEFSRTTTDPSGAFTFLGVPAGDYVLKGRLYPRPAPNVNVAGAPTPAVGLAAAQEEATLWTATPISAGSTDITNLTVQLNIGLRVLGRVEFAGARSQPSPAEIQRIGVRMQLAEGRTSSPISLDGRVLADGTFKTSGYPAGRYIANILPNTVPPGWSVKSILMNGRDVSVEPLELTDADVSGVVVVFTDKATTLSGSVTNAKGPDPTAEVVIFPADSMAWKEIGVVARRGRVERVTAAGTFSITGLPPGDYFVAAASGSLAGDRQDPALLAVLMRDAQRVTLADGGSATVQVAVKR
jgi:hypothetical protein